MSVPVLPVSRQTLVMPLVGALDSARLVQIQEQALGRLAAARARRLLLDITGVPVVDSQVAQGLISPIPTRRSGIVSPALPYDGAHRWCGNRPGPAGAWRAGAVASCEVVAVG